MNRLKLWIFAILVLALAAFGLRWLDVELRKQAVGAVDRQLTAAQVRAESVEQQLLADLAAVAALASKDARLVAALQPAASAPEPGAAGKRKPASSPAVDPAQADAAAEQAAAEAFTGAQGLLGTSLPGHVVMATSREGLARRSLDADAAAFLQGALARKVPRGHAVLGGKLFAGVAVAVGEDGALAAFAPLDADWASAAAASTGATLILSVPGQRLVAGARLADAEAISRAARPGPTPSDAGTLAPVDVAPPGLRIQLPPVRSFLGSLPADRVVAKPLAGVKDGQLVVAASTRALLAPLVKAEWYGAAALAIVLLLTLIFWFLVKPTEMVSPVPSSLLDAARKIERGDFSARAPVLAGKVGTVAEALNRAAEAAEGAAAAPPRPAAAAFGEEAGGEVDPFSTSSRALRAAAAEAESRVVNDTARLDGANLSGAAFEAAPVSAPRPPVASPEPVAAPAAPLPPEPAAAAPAAPPAPAARAVPTGEPAEDEQHWRDVFRDFVRTRGECGESAEGLTYERFRQKLEANRSALVAKYGCKTVRFQVYVKEGKAALKATPVR